MTNVLKNQTTALISDLNKIYKEFEQELKVYIDSFDEDILFSFFKNDQAAKKYISQHYCFAAKVLPLYDETNNIISKLSQVLCKSYDINDTVLISNIDKEIKKHLLFQQNFADFLENCEKEIQNNKDNQLPKHLYKLAIELKQKNEFIKKS